MYKIEESKCNFANKSDTSVCQACLSSDRKLSSIGEFVDIFMHISNIPYNVTSVLSQPIYLCWECMAILKKIKLFKTQLEEAQKILRNELVKNKKCLLNTLSKLTTNNSDSVIINITHDDDYNDDKEKLVIKYENDHSDDDINYHQNSNDLCLEEIKKEKETLTKKNVNKKKKVSHYRIISDLNSKKALRKKFSIQPDDPKIWLDRERNSDYYESLRYKCSMCVRGFVSKKKLQSHLLKHTKSAGPYACQTCSIHCGNKQALLKHVRAHNYAWQCARCGFQCYTTRRLRAHTDAHSAVQCAHCDAQFPDLTEFYAHYKALHTIFLCDHCGKRCKSKNLLQKHMTEHTGLTCATCARRYKSRAALRKHARAAHAHGHAYCVVCDKHYRNPIVYNRHVQTSAAHAHERNTQLTKKFQCPECSNTYSRRVYMMNHYRHVHTNQSKHYCALCDRHFLNRTRYVEHMKYNHEGVKKEKNKLCNVCGRGFAANRTLTNHMRTHSGERPYECSYCSAKFTQRTSMLSHVRYIHLKDKRPTAR